MTEQFISLKTAKLAQDKGFNEYQRTFYHNGSICDDYLGRTASGDIFEAPTQSLLQKWLRDVHDLVIVIRRSGDCWHWYIQGVVDDGYESSYESALEAGLLAGLSLL